MAARMWIGWFSALPSSVNKCLVYPDKAEMSHSPGVRQEASKG